MNRYGYYAAVISLILFFAGCTLAPNPKEVLSNYLDNYFQGNSEKAYEFLSAEDKTIKSQQDFSTAFFGGFTKALAGKTTFSIKEVKVSGDKALAIVDVTEPDLNQVMGEFLGTAMKSILSGGKPDGKEMENIVAEKMKGRNLPTITRTEQFDLVKGKDGWRVYMGWENEKKINELKATAEKLEKQKNFAEAKVKYSEIMALSSRDDEAPRKVKELDEKVVEYKEKRAYFPNIEIRNIEIRELKYLHGSAAFGEIKNKGDRSLKRVEVTTYCLDKDDKVVLEKDSSAVLVSEYSFGGRDNTPLKPNYSRQFIGGLLDSAPSDWSGKVRVEVTDLEFE